MIHPRWWIKGPSIQFSNWRPGKIKEEGDYEESEDEEDHKADKVEEVKETEEIEEAEEAEETEEVEGIEEAEEVEEAEKVEEAEEVEETEEVEAEEAEEAGLTDHLSLRRRQHSSTGQHIMDLLSKLSSTQRASLDARINQFDQEILKEAQKAVEDYEHPAAMPLPVPKRKFVRKHTHGKADARGLTGAEIAERELKREAKERVRGRTQSALDSIHGPVLGPSTTAIDAQFLLPMSTAISFVPYALPPSTAPAALQTKKRLIEHEEDEANKRRS